MEQIHNDLKLLYDGKSVYNALVNLEFINIRYGNYKGHHIIKEDRTSRNFSIDIVGPDGKEYSWNVAEHYNEKDLTVISEKMSQLSPFKFFRSIYRIKPGNNSCILAMIKEFELEENSGYQLGQILPSLRMTAKQNLEQVKHELENIL